MDEPFTLQDIVDSIDYSGFNAHSETHVDTVQALVAHLFPGSTCEVFFDWAVISTPDGRPHSLDLTTGDLEDEILASVPYNYDLVTYEAQ